MNPGVLRIIYKQLFFPRTSHDVDILPDMSYVSLGDFYVVGKAEPMVTRDFVIITDNLGAGTCIPRFCHGPGMGFDYELSTVNTINTIRSAMRLENRDHEYSNAYHNFVWPVPENYWRS